MRHGTMIFKKEIPLVRLDEGEQRLYYHVRSAAGVVIIREHVHGGQQLVGVDERTANDERA